MKLMSNKKYQEKLQACYDRGVIDGSIATQQRIVNEVVNPIVKSNDGYMIAYAVCAFVICLCYYKIGRNY